MLDLEERKEVNIPINQVLINQVIDQIDYYLDQFTARITEPNSSYFSKPIQVEYLREMRGADHQAWLRTMKAYFLRLHEWFIHWKSFKSTQDVNELAAHFMKSLAPENNPTIEMFEFELCYQIEKWR